MVHTHLPHHASAGQLAHLITLVMQETDTTLGQTHLQHNNNKGSMPSLADVKKEEKDICEGKVISDCKWETLMLGSHFCVLF